MSQPIVMKAHTPHGEKRSDRLDLPRQIRFGPTLAHHIRVRAEMNDRTIQGEILHLIKVGIRAEPLPTENGPDCNAPKGASDDASQAQ